MCNNQGRIEDFVNGEGGGGRVWSIPDKIVRHDLLLFIIYGRLILPSISITGNTI